MSEIGYFDAQRVDPLIQPDSRFQRKGNSILPLLVGDKGRSSRSDVALASIWLNALANNRLELHAQHIKPLANESNGCDDWYEVLLRRRGNDGKLYGPNKFIALAERHGLMRTIDRWVLIQALDWLAYPSERTIKLSVNLSATSIECRDTIETMLQAIDSSRVDPSRLCIELTETAAINDIQQAKKSISKLKELGCTIALDDFGTGESSFLYLQYFNIDFLKIDAGFVNSLQISRDHPTLIKAIVKIAQQLDIQTIAEGIQNPRSVEMLRIFGVEYGQGFFLGNVGPLADLDVSKPRSADLAWSS